MSETKAWAVYVGNKLWSRDFFRIRANAQIYVGRRGMGADTYRKLCAPLDPLGDMDGHSRSVQNAMIPSKLWHEFRRTHKGARLVRVRVKP